MANEPLSRPEIIGKVVTVQVFELSHENPGEIHPGSIEKFVGELLSYQKFNGGFAFKIRGLGRRTYLYKTHVVEIYPHES